MMKTIKTKIGNLFIWIGNKPGVEKITIGGMTEGIHYTLIFNGYQNVINFHKTTELGKHNKKSYEKILEMRFFTFKRFLLSYSRVSLRLIHRFWFARPITLDSLQRQNILITPFVPQERDSDSFVYIESEKKIRFAKEIDPELILKMFIHPHQIIESDQNCFWAYSYNYDRLKMEGFIFRPNSTYKGEEFYFVSNRSFKRFAQQLQPEIFDILNGLDFKGKEAVVSLINNTQ